METKFNVSIPKPCHEDWISMTPLDNGRFCSVCTKGVVDFTHNTTQEIQEYFIRNQGQKVCGRFKNEQVNRLTIPIPKSVLEQNMSFHKAFLLTLFVVMGSTLFSCKTHNDDYIMGDPVVVEDTVKNKEELLTRDTTAVSVDTIQHHATIGIIAYPNIKVKNKVEEIDTKAVYQVSQVDIQPSFPKGMKNYYKFISSNFKISEANKKIIGNIFVTFIVEANGNVSNIKVVKGINEELNLEAIRVIKASGKWLPGEINRQKVRVSFTIPIKITSEI